MRFDEEQAGVAVVGVGAILPDAPDAATFWENVRTGHSSIGDVPPSRWDPELYYDPDPAAPDKTYSRIGGWVREWTWDPMAWKLPIPPKVAEAMDDAQKWAVACTRSVLEDHAAGGGSAMDRERTAVILGNALAGELHYMTSLRIYFPEYAEALAKSATFSGLPEDVRHALIEELHHEIGVRLPRITEDTMPGELANIVAGRVANVFNFRGPSLIADAACGSAIAAVDSAVRGLLTHDFDAAITGGVDRNMGATAFVKFCKIGALSATGTRPYAEGADGFVMGEGAALFLLKRLDDAERDGDRIYAVIRGIAGLSDGRGKGITAPNPIGQRLAVERAWRNAGLDPTTATLVEGHGTSTRVGDVVEVESLTAGFGATSLSPGSIALGSVKSNIGHLKAAAGGAGLLKTILALHDGVLPPSINFHKPNPNIDFARSPFRVNTELREWERPAGGVRRAGVSAFGFGGTNWHAVLEEYVPGASGGARAASMETRAAQDVTSPESTEVAAERPAAAATAVDRAPAAADTVTADPGAAERMPLRGALVVGGETTGEISERLAEIGREAAGGRLPSPGTPRREDLAAAERVAIDYADAEELAAKVQLAVTALEADAPATWKALKGRGIFHGSGPAPKVAFLYPGQGSQYANMARTLAEVDPIVADTFAEADEIMTPLLGRSLTSYLFADPDDPAAMAEAEVSLMQTAITQPAVLAVDSALTKLLAAYGIEPDMVMGHSLGEYGALGAAGSLTFPHALEAVSARGREMTSLSIEDNGKMAAVIGPLVEVERILAGIDGNVVIANVNSTSQAVIGGASDAVDRAVAAVTEAGMQAIPLPVSHAFHTSIVAPASDPLRRALDRLDLHAPRLPIVANVSGEFYPTTGDVKEQMLDILAAQVASPVQFVKGLHTLYEAGARVFVEVGPKKALQSFVDDVLAGEEGVVSLFTNHPKVGDVASFNQALCGLYAAGFGLPKEPSAAMPATTAAGGFEELGRAIAGVLAAHPEIVDAVLPTRQETSMAASPAPVAVPVEEPPARRPVVITGAGIGLPGTEHVFDEANIARILGGEQLIGEIPPRLRTAMLDKHITRLVKRENGDPSFETIADESEVIKLAGRAGAFDLEAEFGVAAERIPALDRSTKLAVAAGIDALRDAGIPMVMRYKTTTKGTKLPERWGLPPEVADTTGVVFASAFPGLDAFAGELNAYHRDRARRERLEELRAVRTRVPAEDSTTAAELDRRIAGVEEQIEAEPYGFDRRFLFRTLSMGHSQFAEIVGARGPNTQLNAACASTTQAVALAEDWIAEGRCKRVVIVAADDATSDNMMEWIGAGFLASGAAATDDVVEDAATPFDRRRHGMIVGMGAAALVVESAAAAEERGIRPIVEVLAAVHGNSAFHGTRLDVKHISGVMESLVAEAERRWGIRRDEIASEMVFVSHETYTPARGGSAAAEVEALRFVFGPFADKVVVANTKGFTGHPMGVGIEDVVAVRILESGIVPPVPNYKEVDPDLGTLNLSKGGSYPVRYALRLAAGFGSQIAMSLVRWVPTPDGTRVPPSAFGFAGRMADAKAFNAWLTRESGLDAPELEVVQHRLRIRDEAEAARRTAAAAKAGVVPEP
ncbi:MAG TPA: beta-ketoacyl synthase N-terminal-like domain-containing protein, partial [Actinomycetota bacterium]|nr:beta-ketoacyl synthase N-terminal-like domain-containing protein [Actinomycetota bacterium]